MMMVMSGRSGGEGSPSTRYRNPSIKPAWYKARQRSITPAQKAAERWARRVAAQAVTTPATTRSTYVQPPPARGVPPKKRFI